MKGGQILFKNIIFLIIIVIIGFLFLLFWCVWFLFNGDVREINLVCMVGNFGKYELEIIEYVLISRISSSSRSWCLQYWGLKWNIFILNIYYFQFIFCEYLLFFVYFKINIYYFLKKVDVFGYIIFRFIKREGLDKLYCSKDKISYKV